MSEHLDYGVNANVSIEDYHADKRFVSSTTLKKFAKSPALLTVEDEVMRSSSLTIGSLVHSLALKQEDEIERVHVVEHDRRTKAYKEWKAELPEDAIEVTKEEWRTGLACANALYGDRIARGLLEKDGRTEHSYCWVDRTDIDGYRAIYPEAEPLSCKMRPDRILLDDYMILDIKTCSKFSERDIRRAFTDFGYHIQAAHYLEGASIWLNCSLVELDFVFLFVESKPPFRTAVVELDHLSMDRSIDYRHRLVRLLVDATLSQNFSDKLSNTITQVTLPEWSYIND